MNYEAYLHFLEFERNYSPTTIRAYQYDLATFSRYLDDHNINDPTQVNHAVIGGYIQALKESPNGRFGRSGLSDATIARRLAVASSFLDYTRATTMPDLRNPLKDLKRKRQKNDEPKPVDEAILEELLAGITVLRDKVMFLLYLATGLRLVELRSLNRDSINFELTTDAAGVERLLGSGTVVGKGSTVRRFYVDEETLSAFSEYLSSRSDENPALFLSERRQRISARAIQFTLSMWCQRLGLPNISPHRLRHTFATRLANAHIDPMQLMDLMGHRSFNTTRRYFKIYDEVLAQGYFAAMEAYRPTSR